MAKYKGRVFALKSFKNENESNNVLDDFKKYWLEGFSPNIGADRGTHRPKPSGHRHVHMVPESLDKKWMLWQNANIVITTAPTSDTGLFYFVDINRNAYVFYYINKGMHDFLNSSEFKDIIDEVYNLIILQNISIMEHVSQEDLFSKKWLK